MEITLPPKSQWGLGEAFVRVQLFQSQENGWSGGVLTNPLPQQKISTDLQSGTLHCLWQALLSAYWNVPEEWQFTPFPDSSAVSV